MSQTEKSCLRARPVRIRLVDVKRLTIFIAISVAIHLVLKSGLFTLADYYLSEHRLPAVTQIELVESQEREPTKTRPIIKQLKPLDPVDNDNSQARFDSEQTQRVAKETKARNVGVTRNSNKGPKPSQASEDQKSDHSKNSQPKIDDEDLPEFTKMNFSNPQQFASQNSSLSQVLPNDIQVADATNLNTDANTYYSFYSRVEELFYVRWGERLNFYWNRLSFDFKKNQLAGHVWSTTLEVLLTSSGEYYSASVFQSSGYPPFDEAAVFAFKDAQFFPNPPKAKIDADGFVRLRYRLAVHVGSLR